MGNKISVVINTLNEEKVIEWAIRSVSWADEVIVCDMHSEDKTVEIAKNLGAKTVSIKRMNFVEPARNLAISKAAGDWVFVLDPDEEVSPLLKNKLKEIASLDKGPDYVEIPRKNIIFNKWMQASMWWPDYHPRFFKKGKVVWKDKIHSKPEKIGSGLNLEAEEKLALIHHHYENVGQFIERLNRYTSVEAEGLKNDGYKFDWRDLIIKPTNEFLSRFFDRAGYKDGIHGLILGLLQAFSFLVVYIKVWELEGFEEKEVDIREVKETVQKSSSNIDYWLNFVSLSPNPLKRALQKVKNKLR